MTVQVERCDREAAARIHFVNQSTPRVRQWIETGSSGDEFIDEAVNPKAEAFAAHRQAERERIERAISATGLKRTTNLTAGTVEDGKIVLGPTRDVTVLLEEDVLRIVRGEHRR